MTDLLRPTAIRQLLEKHGLRPQKALGQNFITDANHLNKILLAAGLRQEDCVLEIGPGIGTLTIEIASRAKRVTALEIDRGLIRVLAETCSTLPNVQIIHEDALKADLNSHLRELISPGGLPGVEAQPQKAKVLANLPYYITTPLIFRLLDERALISRMVLLVQREVAQRLSAAPAGADYGSLSVALAYACDVSVLGDVPPSAFYPRPGVISSIVRLDMLPQPRVAVRDEALFYSVIRASFGQRRKTLRNSLSAIADKRMVEASLEKACIDPQRRGETLSIEEFGAIADALACLQSGERSARL